MKHLIAILLFIVLCSPLQAEVLMELRFCTIDTPSGLNEFTERQKRIREEDFIALFFVECEVELKAQLSGKINDYLKVYFLPYKGQILIRGVNDSGNKMELILAEKIIKECMIKHLEEIVQPFQASSKMLKEIDKLIRTSEFSDQEKLSLQQTREELNELLKPQNVSVTLDGSPEWRIIEKT